MGASCEQFEVWVEQRRYGALPPEQAGVLEGHLVTCPACRGFEASSAASAGDLGSSRPAPVDWGKLRERVEVRARSRLRALWSGAAAPLLLGWTLPLVPALSGVRIHDWSSFGAGLATAAALAAVYAVVVNRTTQRRLRAGTDLLPFLRTLVQGELRAAYFSCAYLPAIALWLLVVVPLKAAETSAPPLIWVARAALGVVALVGAAYFFAVRIPALRQERATLDGALS